MVYELKEQLSRPDVEYPSYYIQQFHAYDEGNLNWQAAFEVESATYSMALRVWPNEGLEKEEAQQKLRASFLNVLRVGDAFCPGRRILTKHFIHLSLLMWHYCNPRSTSRGSAVLKLGQRTCSTLAAAWASVPAPWPAPTHRQT